MKMYEAIKRLSQQVEIRYGEGLEIPSGDQNSIEVFEFKTNPELENWFGLGFSDLPPYETLTSGQVVDVQIRMREDHEDLVDRDGDPNCWCDILPATSEIEYCETLSEWPNDWIPIATSRGGSSVVFVDLMPAKDGTAGQVVHASSGVMLLGVVGKSITDWLTRISNAVENGLFHDDEFYVFEPEIRYNEH